MCCTCVLFVEPACYVRVYYRGRTQPSFVSLSFLPLHRLSRRSAVIVRVEEREFSTKRHSAFFFSFKILLLEYLSHYWGTVCLVFRRDSSSKSEGRALIQLKRTADSMVWTTLWGLVSSFGRNAKNVAVRDSLRHWMRSSLLVVTRGRGRQRRPCHHVNSSCRVLVP